MSYTVVETDERVAGLKVELVTRFESRAFRRARSLNAQRLVPFYRWEAQWDEGRRRWFVVAMQNVARPDGD
jgi:hypothetical protein